MRSSTQRGLLYTSSQNPHSHAKMMSSSNSQNPAAAAASSEAQVSKKAPKKEATKLGKLLRHSLQTAVAPPFLERPSTDIEGSCSRTSLVSCSKPPLSCLFVLLLPLLCYRSPVTNRCGAVQSVTLSSSSEEALDGIIGFGQSNFSMLSQISASRKVKKVFSHCLDNIRGGGIFAIGEVVELKVSNSVGTKIVCAVT
ncbi:hypothetical protein JHK87_055228 [Glycine soja]|nr:hypothetical protein JHK87_055228 [Glycine soja]